MRSNPSQVKCRVGNTSFESRNLTIITKFVGQVQSKTHTMQPKCEEVIVVIIVIMQCMIPSLHKHYSQQWNDCARLILNGVSSSE